ncbi:glycosyltransferase [Desulfofundulus thermobenzoicus]|uniref:Glycosyltransferase n=1 Tax=Desulfofundulus thermobenzoicus TaxID=29376 RepID=A0A6N7IQW9_9FIRM|nr:glycosyltransferase family 4 protein [Desulfofundulus thermobenzoicus]MQL52420.1 glycosyltransferase [Desulfofundulus thermobenzoicus]
MKIAVFTDSYRPYTSGVVHSIETFTCELTALGHEIYIFAPSYPHCRNENRVFRFPSIPAPTNRDFTLAIPFSPRLNSVISKWQPDIIHVHSPFLLGQVGARFARKLGVPLVFTFHTLYDHYVHYVPFARNLTRALTRRYCRDFCNQCHLVITPTSVIGKHLKEMGVKTRICNIPTGIKLEDFAEADSNWLQSQFGLNREEKILLFVGRLGREKNIDFLLKAFARITKELPQTRLVLVGGGPEESNLKKLATRLGIASRVLFTGPLARMEVIKCYRSADLFVFASKTETQGLVLAEARASGLPVVAVKAFGTSEMVVDGDDGFLTGESIPEFTSHIKKLLAEDDLRQRMSVRARINAQSLSSRNCALKLSSEYSTLLENKNFLRKTV